ncbi:Xyloglucan galactosyltransferase KATAMARI1-like protein [Dichanthelium oligosanthes]|uniref:Xyloglucan galactosyltransferase KATAMARI1-like protein n=1 Tax=Dichanthelium oligosanthes TaxID=888268 RepID=A0A1E5W892_9POAL|nr:Xyloglucan galactosyltransferase KATAMARI1-like protein [Dichanthelium oligosanthes]
MEKGGGKPAPSRLCFLATLCAMFWVLIFYFHFAVVSNDPDASAARTAEVSIARGHLQFPVPDGAARLDMPLAPPARASEPPPAPKEKEEEEQPAAGARQEEEQPAAGARQEEAPPKVAAAASYPFERALRTAENKSDPCGGRYIYVHELPPRFNEDMLRDCEKLSVWTNMCRFMSNDGLGPPLSDEEGVFSSTGWYGTNQFSVDVIFGNRMKQYECLTKDSSIAAAVFVPFYAGFDIARYLWGYNVSTRDAASLDLVDWLMKKPEWNVMGGRDHFLVAGRITWDFRRLTEEESDWGSKLLFLPAAKNMSMLVVESSPWNSNDFGIPYPTYFHPAKDADVFLWQDRMRSLERPWLFSFAGAPRPGDPMSIRGQLIDQCRSSSVCKLLECDLGESKCHSPSTVMKMFQSSLFCLQPQGDSYTRRSAFDSMLAGCIPVFFHPGSAYVQYTWHLPKNYTRYSVFIPEHDIRTRNASIEERLKSIHPDVVKNMREEVINLIPKVIYADPRSKLETLKDAFDVSIQAIINKVTKLRRDIIADREDKDFIEENSWKYNLLEDGQQTIGPHEWDPFFSKPKDKGGDSSGSSAEAAKNSWKIEQRGQN